MRAIPVQTASFLALAFVAVLGLTLASPVSAQLSDQSRIHQIANSRPFGNAPAKSAWQLFDLSRVRLQHSYSMAYVSGSYGSASLGMLQTTLLYDIMPNMSLAVGLSLAHDPSALFNRDQNKLNARVLPSFRLDYQPSKNVFMSVSFERRESLYDGRYGSYYDGRRESIFSPYRSTSNPYQSRGLFDY